MAYNLVIPKEMLSDIYKLREAKHVSSIRSFILIAVEEQLDRYRTELQEIEEKMSEQNQHSKK